MFSLVIFENTVITELQFSSKTVSAALREQIRALGSQVVSSCLAPPRPRTHGALKRLNLRDSGLGSCLPFLFRVHTLNGSLRPRFSHESRRWRDWRGAFSREVNSVVILPMLGGVPFRCQIQVKYFDGSVFPL